MPTPDFDPDDMYGRGGGESAWSRFLGMVIPWVMGALGILGGIGLLTNGENGGQRLLGAGILGFAALIGYAVLFA